MVGREYSRNISVKLLSNICSNTEINANFHFSDYKYMETLSCHSNESTWATTIKNTIYIEANEHLCKASASSPMWILRRDFFFFFFFFFENLVFNQNQRFGQNSYGPQT